MVVLHPFVNHTNEKINELKAEAESIRLKIWNSLNCMIHVTCWKECGMFQVKNLQIVDPDIVRFFGFDFLQIWKVRCSLFSKVLRHMLTRLPSSLGFRNDWSDWNRLWLVQIT